MASFFGAEKAEYDLLHRDLHRSTVSVKTTDMKLGSWPTTRQFAGWRRALRLAVAGS